MRAQEATLTSVFPPGGQRGTTQIVKLVGKNLKKVQRLYFSHPSIALRTVKGDQVTVAIGADVPTGEYDVWALTDKGLSNPRRFVVGQLVEVREKEANDKRSAAQTVKLPTIINGKFSSGTDRDYYRFEIKAGQPFHIQFRSRAIDGSARAALTLYGPDGAELLHDDGQDIEPALDFQVAKPGLYTLKVEERGFQSGDNHVYRLSIFSGPRVVAAFPTTLTRGKSQPVSLYGYALPQGKGLPSDETDRATPRLLRVLPLQQQQVQIEAPPNGDIDGGGLYAHSAMIDGFRFRHPKLHCTMRFGLTDDPLTLDADQVHDSPKKAQRISFPATVAGRFLFPREVDWYRATMKMGQSLWLETVGERLGVPMDLELAVHDAKGKVIQTASDYTVKNSPVPVDTLDAMTAWKAPADGDYFFVIRDLYGTTRFGVTRTYLLSVGKRLEKVCVTALSTGKTPTGLSVPRGGTAKLQIAALRYNGHQDAIRIRVDKLPPGLHAKNVTIPAKKNMVYLNITVDNNARPWIGTLNLMAETKINGKQTTIPVIALTTVRTNPPQTRRCQGVVAAITDKTKPKGAKKK